MWASKTPPAHGPRSSEAVPPSSGGVGTRGEQRSGTLSGRQDHSIQRSVRSGADIREIKLAMERDRSPSAKPSGYGTDYPGTIPYTSSAVYPRPSLPPLA